MIQKLLNAIRGRLGRTSSGQRPPHRAGFNVSELGSNPRDHGTNPPSKPQP
jgi:hypothetical protein